VASGTFTDLQRSIYSAADAAAAANREFKGMRIGSMGEASAADRAYREWLGMESKITAFEQDWANNTLPANLQNYVDDHWAGKANVPGPTRDGIFNQYMMQSQGPLNGDVVSPDRQRRELAESAGSRDSGSTGASDQAQQDALRLAQEQVDQQRRLLETLLSIDRSLTDWRNQWQLGELSNLDPLQQYELASDNLSALFAQARAGDVDAFDDWQRAADAFLQESNSYFGGGTGAAADKEAVFGMWQELAALREDMQRATQRQVDAINRGSERTAQQVGEGNRLASEGLSEAKHQASRSVGYPKPVY
jgi:hypothetical protein